MIKLRILICTFFLLAVSISNSQKITSDSIRLNPEGDMAIELKTNTKKNLLYNRTIKWINAIYQNPENVIVGQQQNKTVNIKGHKPYAIEWKSLGIVGGFGMTHHIYYTFKDSSVNYRFVIDELRNETTNAGAMNYFYCSSIFKKDGSVKPLYSEYKTQLEQKLNELLFSYIDKLNDNTISSDEALAELKKAKDKLDLGIITQQEYDKLKEELMPFIK